MVGMQEYFSTQVVFDLFIGSTVLDAAIVHWV